MIIGEISFCGQIAFNIKSDETKQYILDRLQHTYNIKIIAKHFEKYNEHLLETIRNKPHMLCLRSNGNPYFLYLTRLNCKEYCIFIDKKIQQGYSYPRMIISNFKFKEELFEDTILDGEMTDTSGKWSYLINDIIVHRKEHLIALNFIKRINLLYNMLATSFKPDMYDVCYLKVKKYFTTDEGMSAIEKHLQTIDYSCRGIYIKPLFLRFKDILINFDDNLIKKVERQKYKHVKSFLLQDDIELKDDSKCHKDEDSASTSSAQTSSSSSKETVTSNSVHDGSSSFMTRKTNLPDVYEMLDKNNKPFTYACIPSMGCSKMMREMFNNKNIVDCLMVEYTFSKRFNKWIPIV